MSSNLDWEIKDVLIEYKALKLYDVVEIELVGKYDKTPLGPTPHMGVILHFFTTYRTQEMFASIAMSQREVAVSIEVSHIRYHGRLTEEEGLTHWNPEVRRHTQNKRRAVEIISKAIEKQNKILRPTAAIGIIALIAVIIYKIGFAHAWWK